MFLVSIECHAQGFRQSVRGGIIKGDIDGFNHPGWVLGFEHPLPDNGTWPEGPGSARDEAGLQWGTDYVESFAESVALTTRTATRGHSIELGGNSNHISGLTQGLATAVSTSIFIPGGGQYEEDLTAKFSWGVTAPDTLRDRYANETVNGSNGRIDVDENTYGMRQWCEQVQVSNGEMIGRWRTDLYKNGEIQDSFLQTFPQENFAGSGSYTFEGSDEVLPMSTITQNCYSEIQVVNLLSRTAIYADAFLNTAD